jgi:gliding motility-associated-like protein
VYNRWGEMVFESTDFNTGWDGRYKGELVPKGIYVYLLNYTDTEGFDVNDRGTVMLIY